MERFEVIIIGAGIASLAAARKYLQIKPSVKLLVLDKNASLGGVGSETKVYPGLLPETPIGYFEYSDLTMVSEDRPALSSISSGSDVTAYLTQYATRYGLDRKIRTNSEVTKASKRDGLWHLTLTDESVLVCEKLIISTGLVSTPHIPSALRSSGFMGLILHTADLGKRYCDLVSNSVKSVVIVGGCISAIDAVCLCMAAGKTVHWIIRCSATSPGIIVMTDEDKAYVVAVNATRILNALTPSVFASSGLLYTLLHSGKMRVGSMVMDSYWKMASAVVGKGPKYHASPNGTKMSPPNNDLFWNRGCLTLVDNKGKFLDYLHNDERLHIHDEAVQGLSDAGAHLVSGEVIPADAVVCATGWQKSPSIFDVETSLDLGLPGHAHDEPDSAKQRWSILAEEADKKIATLFPKLGRPPSKAHSQRGFTPYRLYKTTSRSN